MTQTPGWGPQGEPDRPDGWTSPQPGWSPQQPPPSWGQQAWGQQAPMTPPPPGQPGWGWAARPDVKPGVVPLRPIGVGEILDGAISTMRAYPRPMLGLSALVVAVAQLLGLLATWLLLDDLSTLQTSSSAPSVDEVLNLAADAIAVSGVSLVVNWIAILFLTGMLTVVVSKAVLGQEATVAGAWTALRPRLLSLVLLSLVTALLVLAAAVVPFVPGVVAAVAGAPGGVLVLLFLLGFFAALTLAVYVWVVLGLATPALVLEKQGVGAAISRSRLLVRGSWWRVFGIMLLAAFLTTVISSIIATPFQFGSIGLLSDPSSELSFSALLLATVGGIIGYTITYPFSAGVSVLLYVDQRMRREGLDLELARAAGAPAPDPTPPTWGQHQGSAQSPNEPPRW